MARVFKRKDRLSAMSEINITSLLDLVFCLLIIFMITTPLLEQTVGVSLPQQSRDPGSQRDKDIKYVAVSVTRDGRMYLGKQEVSAQELLAHFRELATQPDPPVINLRGDLNSIYQKEIDVVDLMKQAGLKKLSLDTQVK